MATMYENVCGNCVGIVDICVTFHMRGPTELPHKFSYIVAILIHNYFESPNI
jgi:hypothetical protein